MADDNLEIKYHKSYNIDQAGLGVIAPKDVEAFPTRLIKERRFSKSWRFQAVSHENLVLFVGFYKSHGLIYLVYEYEHLAICLGCMAGIVDFSEGDIATVCREVLSGILYIHSELKISHGAVDCSNVLQTWKGEVKIGV